MQKSNFNFYRLKNHQRQKLLSVHHEIGSGDSVTVWYNEAHIQHRSIRISIKWVSPNIRFLELMVQQLDVFENER